MESVIVHQVAVSSTDWLDRCSITQRSAPSTESPSQAPEDRKDKEIQQNIDRDTQADHAENLSGVTRLHGHQQDRTGPEVEQSVSSEAKNVQPKSDHDKQRQNSADNNRQ